MVIINKRILRKEMIDGFQDFYSYHFLDNQLSHNAMFQQESIQSVLYEIFM